MTRFFSQGEIKKLEAKLKEQDTDDINILKDKLKEDINNEYHRINVDSAKKKAVNQQMDYDGFHQMVLGSDLKGLRPEEIVYIDFKNNQRLLNNQKTKDNLLKKVDVLENMFAENLNKKENKNDNNIKEIIITDDKEIKIKSNEIRTKLSLLDSSDNGELAQFFYLIYEVKKTISIKRFFVSVSPIEPKFYSDILKLLISGFSFLMENEIDDKDFIHEISEICYEIVECLNDLSNLQKLKMFVNKKVKEDIGILLKREDVKNNLDIRRVEKIKNCI